ncbi:MAG: hypothetical protein WBV94_15080 [Blastocatellia bacterium]
MSRDYMPQPRTRKMTIIAQDPSVMVNDGRTSRILTAQVDVPAENLAPGPSGHRVQLIDFDSSTGTLYKPAKIADVDPYINAKDSKLLSDPNFHAQNVYAIVMRTLARFEFALGRRISWGFYGHQIKVAPHAFADANAFYSENDQALMFGYFQGKKNMVFSCLSHDVIAHETTHALVDGLRERYTDPSSPEQAAFHEGFSDVVALLSIFSVPDVVETVIDKRMEARKTKDSRLIKPSSLTAKELRKSALFGLAAEMGQELSGIRGNPLRRSAELTPSKTYINLPEYLEPHKRGEILVAAMMNAFIEVWVNRLKGLGKVSPEGLDRRRVVEEGSGIADYLLTMVIRALDYSPPVDLQFCDFLSALLTADRAIRPDDSKYNFRKILLKSFESYGLPPTSTGDGSEQGVWEPPKFEPVYDRTHFESMQRDPDEVFRFIWENRKSLGLYEDAYSRVLSVRPCLRIGPDGFALRETVAEYIQMIKLAPSELKSLGVKAPVGMPPETEVTLYGGGALIFDEYGRLRFHIYNRILNAERQTKRLEFLWKFGYFSPGRSQLSRFSSLHRRRAMNIPTAIEEEE